jgi:outer membrane protein assembly factor BamE (lipoprotein component of BamABCDE complex)
MTTRAPVKASREMKEAVRCIVCLGIAWTFGHASAEVYRCTVDGRVIYTDQPCGNQGTKISIDSAPTPTIGESINLQNEANLGHIAIGMTPTQVRQAWGSPAEITTERDNAGATEYWTYNRAGETTRISFQNGAVSKIAQTQKLVSSTAAAEPASALTVSQMEDQERFEKAGERRFMRPGMTQADVRGKLGPPSSRVVRPASFGMADCWSYDPTPRDAQTLTILCFSVIDTLLVTIERTIQR